MKIRIPIAWPTYGARICELFSPPLLNTHQCDTEAKLSIFTQWTDSKYNASVKFCRKECYFYKISSLSESVFPCSLASSGVFYNIYVSYLKRKRQKVSIYNYPVSGIWKQNIVDFFALQLSSVSSAIFIGHYTPYLTKIFSLLATSELQLMIPAWPNLSHSVCC